MFSSLGRCEAEDFSFCVCMRVCVCVHVRV